MRKNVRKRAAPLLVAAMMLLPLASPMTMYANDAQSTVITADGFRWETNGTSATLTGIYSNHYLNYSNDIVIPDTYNGLPVTAIANDAFLNRSYLTSVTIPSTVTSIGDSAFSGCTGLTSVSIPEGVQSIGEQAFYGCTNLTSVTIPSTVTTIGLGAFSGCSNLVQVNLSEGLHVIGNQAFYGTKLTSVVVPSTVTLIDAGAFYQITTLSNVVLQEGLLTIGNNAFDGCTGLTSITIPSTVTTVKDRAFMKSGLTSLTYGGTTYDKGVVAINAMKDGGATVASTIFYATPSEFFATANDAWITDEFYIQPDYDTHNHTLGGGTGRINVVEATCDKAAHYDPVEFCVYCYMYQVGATVYEGNPLGHDYGDEWTVTKEATCDHAGEEQRVCIHDNSHVETREIAKLDHTAGEAHPENIIEPTCQRGGCYDSVMRCTECNEILSSESINTPKTDHQAGEAVVENEQKADCENGGYYDSVIYCTECGTEINRETIYTDPLDHDWGDWITNINATCTSDGEDIRYCKRDGNHMDRRTVTSNGHVAGEATKENEIEATCTTNGSYDKVIRCTGCGMELDRQTIPTPALDHDWNGRFDLYATCTDKGLITDTCDRCHTTKTREYDALGHDYGEWTVSKPATCDKDGVESRVCSRDILHIETRPINATGHIAGDVVIENNVDEGCVGQGSYDKVVYCTKCNGELSRETITTTGVGHDWDEGVVSKNATCTEDGELLFTCLQCGDTYTDVIDAHGHDYGTWTVTNYPTCDAAGEEQRICSHDNNHVEKREVEALGHDYGQWTQTIDPDCETAGEEQRVCSRDENHKETRPVDPTGHTRGETTKENEVAATCTEKGHYDSVVNCTVCDKELSRETIETNALNHDWGEWSVTVDPTCETAGEKERVCKRNGDHKETGVVSALNHDYGDWTITTEPTCETTGEEQRVCKNDANHVEKHEISATGHKAGEPVKENEVKATCTTKGHYEKVVCCTVCNKELSREQVDVEATGHDYESDVTKEATCTTAGEKTFTCNNCSDAYTEAIEALGHVDGKLSIENVVEATCTTKGSQEEVISCERCDAELSRETVEVKALGHKAGEPVKENEVKATCENKGSYDKVTYCDRCDVELSREAKETPATGHDWGDGKVTIKPTCETVGEETRVCKNDSNHVEKREIPATGHTAGEPVKEKEVGATCETDGSYDEVIYCKDCDKELSCKKVVIPAFGHNYDDGKITKEPTCIATGVKTFTCENCKDTYTEKIDALGHVGSKLTIKNVVEPTCTKKGSHDNVVSCERCDTEISRKTVYTDALGHIDGEPVVENRVDPQIGVDGSYDEVIYCERCGEELHREVIVIPALIPEPEPVEPEDEPEEPTSERIDRNVVVTAVTTAVVSLSGGSAGILVFLFWWRRRRVRGVITGEYNSDLLVTLVGKDNLETHTNEHGEFVFKNLKEDDLLLTVYDANGEVVFTTEVYTHGKKMDDIFTVVESKVSSYLFDKRGKTLEVNIEL